MNRPLRYRALFSLLVTPIGVAGRPLWRRRLGLGRAAAAPTYWRDRGRELVGPDSLRTGG